MPIYEYACGHCRKIYSFFSKRVTPEASPVCPQCGASDLRKEVSSFAFLTNGATANADETTADDTASPNLDDPRVDRALREIEKDIDHIDERNPRHMAELMRRMKDVLPSEDLPKELDQAIRRMEKGEDLDTIEADMGDEIEAALSENDSGVSTENPNTESPFDKDPGLYDM